ncbi:hypothetical protein PHMEG_00017189 [Phytophthora megakarya]|uniref:Uncharacterized protein n=1 Tax=Phytophthora megakarya TaxID=4795 RepID=A0A225VXE8_9STRA|nr:hypothetical protein PHMEG_00017189 [Phytophthora megakarya]
MTCVGSDRKREPLYYPCQRDGISFCVFTPSKQFSKKLFLSPDYESFRDRYQDIAPTRKQLLCITEVVREMDYGATLRELEVDTIFVLGVYRSLRWLQYNPAYGITSPEEEERQAAFATIDHLASTNRTDDELTADAESKHVRRDYEKVSEVPLAEPQAVFCEKVKQRWAYVHPNAMGITYMLNPSTD